MKSARSSNTVARLLFASWLLALVLFQSGACAQLPQDNQPHFKFDQAEFVISDVKAPPLTGWRPQSLPDSWLHSRPGFVGIGWYRVQFLLDHVPPTGLTLFVSRVAQTGQFWLNGAILNPEVRFERPDGHLGTTTALRPIFVPVPAGLLRTGKNELHVRVQGFSVGGDGLWEIHIGSREALHASFLLRQIPQVEVPRILFGVLLVGVCFGLALWWRERRRLQLHFAVVMVLWTIIVGEIAYGVYVFGVWPMTRIVFHAQVIVLMNVFYWLLLLLFYRFSKSDWHWYPQLVNIVFVPTMVTSVLVATLVWRYDAKIASQLLGWCILPSAILRALATVMLLQAAWRNRSFDDLLLAGGEMMWFAGHLQLIGIFTGALSPEPFRLDPASSAPLCLVLIYLFGKQFSRDREQAGRDKEMAVHAERARILQDMHDGLGGQLVTALRLSDRVDSDRTLVTQNIEDALQDLRLIIDALDLADDDLAPALANLRFRLEPRLTALGVRLRWDIQPLPELTRMSPHGKINVLRILQEALNNAIRHSQASQIRVATARAGGKVTIEVTDNGAGFDSASVNQTGRGLAGMRKRAQDLAAELNVESRPGGGTCVVLRLAAFVGESKPAS